MILNIKDGIFWQCDNRNSGKWLNARTGVPVVELILQVDTGSEEADGRNGEPLLAALHWFHQFWHQPSLQ